MAVLRQFNFISQARFDVPHGRLLESAVAGDFDALAGYIMSGKQPLVVTGFSLDPSAVGTKFENLKVLVAGSAALHFGASESGTIYTVPAGIAAESLTATNTNVSGSAVNGTDNFVGLDLVRVVDDSTRDRVAFLDADTKAETSRSIPLGRTLKYRFIISTRTFSSTPNVLPLAIVSVNANGIVTQVTDARKMMFRLGSGGDSPNPLATYLFSARKDGAASTTTAGTNPFVGGDKDLASQKAWQDAMMTRLWEVGGGEYWYSQTAFQDVSMHRDPALVFTNNDNFEVVAGNVHWRGITFAFANSTATTNVVTDQTTDSVGLTDLAVGECVYVDLDRSTDGATLTAHKASLVSLGTSVRPGSRIVLAWRTTSAFFGRGAPYPIGSLYPAATTSALGAVKLASAYTPDAAHPEVPTMDATSATGTLANVLAGGLTRGTTTAGALSIGAGANDTTVNVGRVGQTTAIAGNETVAGTLGVTGAATVGGTLGVTSGATVGGTLAVTGAATLSGGATVTGTMAAGTVNATSGYQLAGAPVPLFPVAYATLFFNTGGAGASHIFPCNQGPTYNDVTGYNSGVGAGPTAGCAAAQTSGTVDILTAGDYEVAFSITLAALSATTSALTARAVQVVGGTVTDLGLDHTVAGNLGEYHHLSGRRIVSAVAGDQFKIQITSGQVNGSNIGVNGAQLTVHRVG